MIRTCPEPGRRDAGLTLIELLISVVLTTIIGGVISAALITSMNAADVTTSSVKNSTDASLIAAFLTRDAQAAGATDPSTAVLVDSLGVSTATTTAGWAACQQSGAMVVRFSWLDRRSVGVPVTVVATYALSADGRLTRRACQNATSMDVVLGRDITSAVATCAPITCTGLPDTVTLAVRGRAAAAPFEYSLTASLRGQVQTLPTSVNSAAVPLLALGSTTCPVLTVSGPGELHILGDAVVNGACGAGPTSGDLSLLRVIGATTVASSLVDPYGALVPPAAVCIPGAGNPTIGSSVSADALTVYHSAVSVTTAVAFQPGRHVFCGGLTFAPGAQVTGTGVLWYVPAGAVNISSAATVDISPATSGPYANLLLWSASSSAVSIASGSSVDSLRGAVYAPSATVAIASESGVRIGGVAARVITVSGTGPTRLGRPYPTLSAAATTLPDGRVGVAYTATAPTVSGGTAPYTWTATGLPAGLSMSSSGALTGTPVASGTTSVSMIAVDATGASLLISRTLIVTAAPVVPSSPSNLIVTPGDTAAVVTWSPGASRGEPATTAYTVTAMAAGQTTRSCGSTPPVTTCTLTGLVNGITYAVTATATNSIGVSATNSTTVMAFPALLISASAQAWLDARDPDGDFVVERASEQCDDNVGCAAASNALTNWRDKSGRGNNATQSTASMAGRFDSSLGAVDFDANGFYTVSSSVSPDMTAFVIAQSDTGTWNQAGWLLSSRLANGVIIHPWPGTAGVVSYTLSTSTDSYTEANRSDATPITSPHIYDMSQSGTGPVNVDVNRDGHPLVRNVDIATTRGSPTTITSYLGGDDQRRAPGRYGDGKYREVVFFDRSLTEPEQRIIHEYLGRKWGIVITPSAPLTVSAVGGGGAATVSWIAPVWNGGSVVTGYRVTATPGGATCTTTATTCSVSGLANSTAYTFTVVALNTIGTGATSGAATATTTGPPGPPGSPTAVAATSADSSLVVSWTAPTGAASTSYTATATAGAQTLTCTATAPATTCTITGLANGTAYSVTVTATNAGGTGTASSPAVSATPEWSPSMLGAGLTWWYDAANASALTGAWVADAGYTVTGSAGSTQLVASSGLVERIDVTSGGSGYTSLPTFTLTGGGGSGALAIAPTTFATGTAAGADPRGTGYVTEPTVTVSGGGGTGGRATAAIMAPTAVGATVRVGGQTYTVIDRDRLVLTVSPALAATVTAAAVEQWRVSTWQNRAMPGTRDASQATTTSRPPLGTIAGRPAVVFDGTTDWLNILPTDGSVSFDKASTWTAIAAYQPQRQVAWGSVSQTTTGTNARIIATAGGGQADSQSAQNIEINPSLADDGRQGGPVRVAVDTSSGADTFNWTQAVIGATAAPTYAPGWGFTGRVGEIVFVNGSLSPADQAKAVDYLTRKWGTTGTPLPTAPITVRAAEGDGQLDITWRHANVVNSTLTTYTAMAAATGRTTRSCTSNTTGCTIAGLVNGVNYTVTVTATSTAGTGTASVPVTATARPALLTTTSAKLWLDAADLDADGTAEGAGETDVIAGAVQAWVDKTGAGRSVTAMTVGERPSSTSTLMNGRTVVTFNGATVLKGATSVNPYGITGDRTMFVVSRFRTDSVAIDNRVLDRETTTNPLFGITNRHRLEVRDDAGGQYQVIGTLGPVVDATDILTTFRAGASLTIWSDGRASGTGTITGTQTMRSIAVGRHAVSTPSSSATPYTNDIAEVILFDRALTVAERRIVEEYLSLKWGVSITPDAPTSAAASGASGVAKVTWAAPLSNGGSPVTGYTVTASPGGATCVTTTLSCTIAGLNVGTNHTFTVTATNAVGTGPPTGPVPLTGSTAGAAAPIITTSPYGGVFDGANVWVANETAGTVSRIDATTNAVATVTVGSQPRNLAFDGANVWVTNWASNTVSKIDVATSSVVATVVVGANPLGITFDGSSIWVSNNGANSISRINTSTNTVTSTVGVTNDPTGLTFAFGSLWMNRFNSGKVDRIDPTTGAITATINIGNSAIGIASDGTSIWSAASGSGSVAKIDPATNTVVATVNTGGTPHSLVAGSGRMWVTLSNSSSIRSIDSSTNALGAPITVGTQPFGIVFTGNLWVMNNASNSVSKLVP